MIPPALPKIPTPTLENRADNADAMPEPGQPNIEQPTPEFLHWIEQHYKLFLLPRAQRIDLKLDDLKEYIQLINPQKQESVALELNELKKLLPRLSQEFDNLSNLSSRKQTELQNMERKISEANRELQMVTEKTQELERNARILCEKATTKKQQANSIFDQAQNKHNLAAQENGIAGERERRAKDIETKANKLMLDAQAAEEQVTHKAHQLDLEAAVLAEASKRVQARDRELDAQLSALASADDERQLEITSKLDNVLVEMRRNSDLEAMVKKLEAGGREKDSMVGKLTTKVTEHETEITGLRALLQESVTSGDTLIAELRSNLQQKVCEVRQLESKLSEIGTEKVHLRTVAVATKYLSSASFAATMALLITIITSIMNITSLMGLYSILIHTQSGWYNNLWVIIESAGRILSMVFESYHFPLYLIRIFRPSHTSRSTKWAMSTFRASLLIILLTLSGLRAPLDMYDTGPIGTLTRRTDVGATTLVTNNEWVDLTAKPKDDMVYVIARFPDEATVSGNANARLLVQPVTGSMEPSNNSTQKFRRWGLPPAHKEEFPIIAVAFAVVVGLACFIVLRSKQ